MAILFQKRIDIDLLTNQPESVDDSHIRRLKARYEGFIRQLDYLERSQSHFNMKEWLRLFLNASAYYEILKKYQ